MVKKEKKKFKYDINALLALSEETINSDIRNLPQEFYLISVELASATREVAKLSADKSKLRGEIMVAEKSSAAYDRPPSDKFVDAMVQDDEEYQTIKQNLIKATYTQDSLKGAVKAMEMRSKLIQTLSSNMRIS